MDQSAALIELKRIGDADLVFAVSQLIERKKTSVPELRALASRRKEYVAARVAELRALQRGEEVPSNGVRRHAARPKASKPKAKAKMKMTPKARAARKLQGQYLGLLRSLNGKQRAAVKKIAKADSVKAAVAAARKLAH